MVQVARWFTDAPDHTSHCKASFADSQGRLRVVRVKNKFGFAREDLNGGYRDLMLSTLYEDINTGLRIIGEIQVYIMAPCI
jgi:hypothetical protein